MADGNTPRKDCVGRKPNAENLNDYCIYCKVSFKVQYGDSWKSISSENLFLLSKKKGVEGSVLSDALQKTGILAEKNSTLFNRVCQKTSEGFSFIVSTLNVLNPKFVQPILQEVKVTNVGVVPRVKRTLPTSLSTPKRRPGQK